MKTINYLLSSAICLVTMSCINTNNKAKQIKITSLEFIDTLYNLGTCIEGDTIDFYVKYKNIGRYPLSLSFAQGSCSCTEPKFNTKTVNSNATDSMKIYYYSNGQKGLYRGTVIIGANTIPSLNQIFFNVNVLPKK